MNHEDFVVDHRCTGVGPVMSAADIVDAHSRGRALLVGEVDRFIQWGVSPQSLSAGYPVLASEVVFLPNGYFEFFEECPDAVAEKAFLLIAQNYGGPVDIVAWQPKTNRIALWLNRAIALGEEQFWGPRFDDAPLPVWRTPMKWLAAGRRGLVILHPRQAFHLLGNLPAIVAEDLEHGTELELLLTPPKPTTQILVPAPNDVITPNQTQTYEAA